MNDHPPVALATLTAAKAWRHDAEAAGEEPTVRLLDALIDAWRTFDRAAADMGREAARMRTECDMLDKQLGDGLHTSSTVQLLAGHAAKLTELQATRQGAAERVQILAHVLDVRVEL